MSVNCIPLLSTLWPIQYSPEFFVVASDRNKPVSLNRLTLCCKGSGVSKRIFFWGFWGESKITYLSANLKRLEVGLTSSNHWLDSKISFIRQTQVTYSLKVHLTFHTKDNHTSRISVPRVSLLEHDAHHEILELA